MIIFVSLRKLLQTFWWLFAAIALYVFYKTVGLSMFFLIVLGLLALKFVPVLVLPLLLIAIGVHFTSDFSFIADILELGIVLVIGVPFCFLAYGCIGEVISEWKQRKSKQ